MYRLFYVDEHWYLFFRYHQILCERLYKIYKHARQLADQEMVDCKQRDQSVAEALKLRNKSDIPVDEYYSTFLDIVRNLLDGNMDSTQYEDTLREMFGISAFIAFTLDKVVHNCVRQLQYLVQDETSILIKRFFGDEQRGSSSASGCGGKVANMSFASVMNAELFYQKKCEALLVNENCYKIISYKNMCRLTIELLDTQSDEDDDEYDDVECEKWSEFLDKYNATEYNNEMDEELKGELLKRCVFLTRNAHFLKQKFGVYKDKDKTKAGSNEKSGAKSTATIAATTATRTSKPDDSSEMNEESKLGNADTDGKYGKYETNKELKEEPSTSYDNFSEKKSRESYHYRKNSLKNAKKNHHPVTKKMYDKFRKFLKEWLKEHSVAHDSIDEWLLGEHLTPQVKTACIKESYLKKTPYHIYYRYKVQQTPAHLAIVQKQDTVSATSESKPSD